MLIDSNVFLEAALAQDHAVACRHFLEILRDGALTAAITEFHIDSVVVVLESQGRDWKEISTFLASLLRYKGLRIHWTGLVGKIKATSIMRDHKLDFDDAIAVQALRDLSWKEVVSYDRHFDSVDWVIRKTPEDLVE